MGTLTLKKPARTAAPIERQPIKDLEGKFAVMRQAKNAKAMRFTCMHDTEDTAKSEAVRLLSEHPENRFLIVQVCWSIEE